MVLAEQRIVNKVVKI